MEKIKRIIPLEETLKRKSVLLLGPRRTGKSFLINNQLKIDRSYDLLDPETFRKLSTRPEILKEELSGKEKIVAIDEIQKIPALMDVVHLLIEKSSIHFLLTGSSARKLKRTHTSLMAGRAKKMILHPLVFPEMHNFDLQRTLQFGSLPIIATSQDPWDELRDYTGLYLKEEILEEALVRKVENFSRFLDFSAMTSGQLLNFESLGRDAQIPARTVKEYYTILEDTLMGEMIYPVRATKKRKSSSIGKFFFFDVGVLNSILGRKSVSSKTKEFGYLFEHYIANELMAYRDYKNPDLKIEFWRDNNETEVDFVLDSDKAIEIKSTEMVQERHIKGLRKFSKEGPCSRKIVVSMDNRFRKMGDVEIFPYQDFLKALWNGEMD